MHLLLGQHSAHLSLRRYFDFEALAEVATQVTRNLNQIIDVNYYPVDTARRSNMRHRPIGMGVQVTTSRCLLPSAALRCMLPPLTLLLCSCYALMHHMRLGHQGGSARSCPQPLAARPLIGLGAG